MAQDQSEEKTLPPSKKKLDDLRRRGQVASSRDMIGAAAFAGGAGVLLIAPSGMAAACFGLFSAAGAASGQELAVGLTQMAGPFRTALLWAVLPPLAAAPLLAILAALVVLRGVPFAVQPVTPNLKHINPVEGFKRLFKLRTLLELIKSVVKVIALGAVALGLLVTGAPSLAQVPACGLDCTVPMLTVLARPMLMAAVGLFGVAGLLDVGVQRWLFTREQKMGITEAKRERRDQDGDPHVRRHRGKLVQEGAQGAARLGLAQATLLVHDSEVAAGLRYRRGETPVPILVCLGRGARARTLLAEARGFGLSLAYDTELAPVLVTRAKLGKAVPDDTFQAVAKHLSRAGLV